MDVKYQVPKSESKELTQEQAHMLVTVIMAEKENAGGMREAADETFCQSMKEEAPAAFIALSRILIAKGTVTKAAACLAAIFCTRAGFAVLFAIDILEAFEGKGLITAEMIGQYVYPSGFYTDDAAETRCDFIKNLRMEYSPYAYLF